MHARRYLNVTFGHQGIQAAWRKRNIRPLKVNTNQICNIYYIHTFDAYPLHGIYVYIDIVHLVGIKEASDVIQKAWNRKL